MAQTPVSASVEVLKGTTTLYTVPAGTTAIVKGIVGGSVIGNASATYTVNKVSSGTTYPITVNQTTTQVNATGGTTINANNLLQAPITLTAGESITIYTSSADALQIPNIASFTNTNSSVINIAQVAYANNIFLAVGNIGGVTAFIARSTDGITWTQISVPLLANINSVSYGGGYWVACPEITYDYGKIYYSSDNALTWTSTLVNSGNDCNMAIYANSMWASIWTNGRLYTASTPDSWTENTAYTNYVYSVANNGTRCIGWTGTNWIFTGDTTAVVYSPDLTTYTSIASINFGASVVGSEAGPLSYSPFYSKWYATYRKNGTKGLYESLNGRNWTNPTIPSFNNLYGVEIAGNNPVLLAVNVSPSGTGANSPYLKSTDGSTWATATDIRNWTGPLIGLENGYFIRYQSNSSSQYYVTTDPTTSTGTANTTSVTNFVPTNLGASDSGSGKWITLGYDSSGNFWVGGGNTASTINNHVNSGWDVASYGYPSSVTYNSNDSFFYWITNTGNIFKQSSYSSSVSYVTNFIGLTGNCSIKYFNGFLYVTSTNGSLRDTTWISNSNNYDNFVAYTVTNVNYNPGFGSQSATSVYLQKKFANDATTLMCINSRGAMYTINSSAPLTVVCEPQGAIHYQRINNTDVFYGGTTWTNSPLNGIHQSTNITTTRPTSYQTSQLFGYYGSSFNGKNNFLAYANSKYYIFSSSNNLFNGSSLANLVSTSVSATSVNGESWANLNYQTEFYVNGSNFYTLSQQQLTTNGSLQLGYTNNIANAVNNSYMTGSIVEIS